MTKEEWKQIEDELFYGLYNSITLKADGHTVYLTLIKSGMKLKILVLVKDVKLVDILGKKEEQLNETELLVRNKFFCKKTKNSINKRALNRSKLSKKEKQMIMDMNTEYTYYIPYFTSFNKLRSSFEKNCDSVERVK